MASHFNANISCWTCRTRKKKCDGLEPSCKICSSLGLRCWGYGEPPPWKDGGYRQAIEIENMKDKVRNTIIERRRARARPRTKPLAVNTSVDTVDQSGNTPTYSTVDLSINAAEDTAESSGMPSYQSWWLTPTNSLMADNTSLDFSTEPLYIPSPKSLTSNMRTPLETALQPPIGAYCDNTLDIITKSHPNAPFPHNIAPAPSDPDPETAQQLPPSLQSLEESTLILHYLTKVVQSQFPRTTSNVGLDLCYCLERLFMNTISEFPAFKSAILAMSLTHVRQNASATAIHACQQATVRLNRLITNGSFSSPDSKLVLQSLLVLMQLLYLNHCVKDTKSCAQLLSIAGATAISENQSLLINLTTHPTNPVGMDHQTYNEQRFSNAFQIAAFLRFDILLSWALRKRHTCANHSLLRDESFVYPVMRDIFLCDAKVLSIISDINELDQWKTELIKSRCMDGLEVALRASNLSDSLHGFIRTHEGTQNTPFVPPNNMTRSRLKNGQSLIYAKAALVYLQVVVSGPWPSIVAIKTAVQDIGQMINDEVTLKEITNPAEVSSLSFPIRIAGCMALPEDQLPFVAWVDHFLGKASPLDANSKSGIKSMRCLMQHCWSQRSKSSHVEITWSHSSPELPAEHPLF